MSFCTYVVVVSNCSVESREQLSGGDVADEIEGNDCRLRNACPKAYFKQSNKNNLDTSLGSLFVASYDLHPECCPK